MKQIFVLSLLFLFSSGYTQVIISEIQSSNSSTISDEWGDYDDWIELYNSGSHSVNIGGMVLKNNAHIWGIPIGDTSTLLSPGSYFFIWADHEESEGIFHANFRLSTSESLILCESDSNTVIDSLIIPGLSEDFSYGICPDGEWRIFSTPTPMEANNCESTINQTIRTNDFLIYPNPVEEIIHVNTLESHESYLVKIFSISGQLIYSNVHSENPFYLEINIPEGYYILEVSDDQGKTIGIEKLLK